MTTLNTADGVISASAVPGATRFYVDQAKTGVFRVDSGFDLDRYMYRSDGPLDFSIEVAQDFGPVDAAGSPTAGNALFNKTGRLTVRVFDVDDDFVGTGFQPERDKIVVNGTVLAPTLSGADGQWSINTFRLPLNLLRLPTTSNPSGRNAFQVLIDTANTGADVWAVETDWAELRLSTETLPLAMIHGFGGDGGDFSDMSAFYQRNLTDLSGRVITPTQSADGQAGIRPHAEAMEDDIAALLRRSASYNVNILAHSKGGLDSRLYAWDHAEQVNKLVMLGTPNGGTRIADIVCGAQGLVFGPRTLALREVLRRSVGECRGPQDGLYQLQQWYVQRVFNKQVPDRRGTFYATIAGTETQDVRGILLDGEDDGLVTVASAEYLSIFNPNRAGKHVPRGVFQVDHNELLSPDEASAPRSLCTLYTATCSRVPASPSASSATQAPLAADATAQAVASGVEPAQSEAVAIATGATVEVPVRFEGAARAFVMVVGEGLQGSVNGIDLAPGGLFGTSILTAEVINPADAPLRLTNAGPGPVEAGIIVFVESGRRMAVTATPELASPGQPIVVEVSLSDVDPGDAPSAAVLDGSGAVVAQLALAAAGPSTWTAAFTPGGPGSFTVVAEVVGSRPRWASQPFTAASGGARLTGTFTESVLDDNANGLADALVVTPTIDVAIPGPYRLAAQLVDGTGTVVASAGSRGVLAAGAQSLALSFPGQDIFRSARSGPYRLIDVVLSHDDDAMAMEQVVADLGATAGYDYRRFEHFPVEIDRDAFADRAVDRDGDGLYDVLDVTGRVSVDEAGSYAVNARLVAADGTEVGEFQSVVAFGTGANTFTLSFPWGPIRAAGVDGPYTVEDLSIYPLADVDVLGYLVVAHQTAPYAAAGQVDSITFARLRSMIDSSAAAGEIDGAGFLRSLQAKVDAGEAAYDRGQLQAARNQLEALRNELWAQRGKRVADPAYLRLDGAVEDLIARL